MLGFLISFLQIRKVVFSNCKHDSEIIQHFNKTVVISYNFHVIIGTLKSLLKNKDLTQKLTEMTLLQVIEK